MQGLEVLQRKMIALAVEFELKRQIEKIKTNYQENYRDKNENASHVNEDLHPKQWRA